MTTADEVSSGKTHDDENFPVASRLIARRHRPAIMAFYTFVRAADDVADHPTLTPDAKLGFLDRLEASLLGRADTEPAAAPLRATLADRKLTPRHALDLLQAFRLDVTKPRTADWADLLHYCSLSAMPVGRYVLDVHGEGDDTWALSDPVCAALQIINHLQDCGKDFRDLDRVYVPADALRAAGLGAEVLGGKLAPPALRAVIRDLATRTLALLDAGAALPFRVRDSRLGMETAVIIALARPLARTLQVRDPLSERVHHGKARFLAITAMAALGTAAARLLRPVPVASAATRRA